MHATRMSDHEIERNRNNRSYNSEDDNDDRQSYSSEYFRENMIDNMSSIVHEFREFRKLIRYIRVVSVSYLTTCTLFGYVLGVYMNKNAEIDEINAKLKALDAKFGTLQANHHNQVIDYKQMTVVILLICLLIFVWRN